MASIPAYSQEGGEEERSHRAVMFGPHDLCLTDYKENLQHLANSSS